MNKPTPARKVAINTPRWLLPLLAPMRFKGAYGGRATGKSHAFAEMLVEAHVRNPHQRTVCIREIQKTLAQSVKHLLEQKIKALRVEDYFDIQESTIKNTRGSGQIIFIGMQNHTADNIKSLEGMDCAWVEEAHTLSQKSLDLLLPTIRKPNSELWFTWNPSKPTDPVDAFLRGNAEGCAPVPANAKVVKVNYKDNPWFPDVLRQEMEYTEQHDKDKYLHIWQGEYQSLSTARVFRNWEEKEFEAPADAILRFGADWGFSVDPTVLVRCYLQGRKLYVDYEAYMVGCELVNMPELFLTVPESEKWPIVADSSSPQTISHLRTHGFPKMVAALKGPRSVEEGVEWLKSYQIIVHPRCQHVLHELANYQYKQDPLTGQVLPLLEDKNNHTIDALRYACESARRLPENPATSGFAKPPSIRNYFN